MWEDDVIPLDEDGVARPIIGLGFSTARPLDIRAGGGEDEVSYNINAPVSVDGGTGFDKLVVLGTEFADDIVITYKAIFGAGLNVRYTTIEVVEVDGLEGDDEFFVLSTAYGVAYRVIGGLGSDTINVTGDVVEDIITRELEGVGGTINYRLYSVGPNGDVLYDGLAVDGLDYNLATPDQGQVIIRETGASGTSVRECLGDVMCGPIPNIDSYTVKLAAAPTANVYVTASAARSTEVEFNDKFANPEPTATSNSLSDGPGDSIWLCTGGASACTTMTDFQRAKIVNGQLFWENGRAVVLEFGTHKNGVVGGVSGWDDEQWVYVYAVDDGRSEGDVVVVVQHSTISADPNFNAVDVRNVEVSLRDNDTPGVYVTQVVPSTSSEDNRTDRDRGVDLQRCRLHRSRRPAARPAPEGPRRSDDSHQDHDGCRDPEAGHPHQRRPAVQDLDPLRRQPAAVVHLLHHRLRHHELERSRPCQREGLRRRRQRRSVHRRHPLRPRQQCTPPTTSAASR